MSSSVQYIATFIALDIILFNKTQVNAKKPIRNLKANLKHIHLHKTLRGSDWKQTFSVNFLYIANLYHRSESFLDDLSVKETSEMILVSFVKSA